MSTELPADAKVVKNTEKAMAKAAKADEKDYKHAVKELKRTEQSEAKAFKAVSKADKHLKKMEENEHNTTKSLQKATHKHDLAVTNLHTAQSDVQGSLGIQKQHAQKMRNNTDTLRVRADELLKAKQVREEERSHTLANLHHPPDPNRTG